MSAVESYNLVVVSSNTSNLIGQTNGTSRLKYFVPWGSILPTEIKKFSVSFSFISQMIATSANFTDAIILSVNFGGAYKNNFEIGGRSHKIGTLQSNSQQLSSTGGTGAFSTFYSAIPCSNPPITIGYPCDQFIDIELLYNNTLLEPTTYALGNYTLIINFTPIV